MRRPWNVGVVAKPLIRERRLTERSDAECHGLAHRDRLAHGACSMTGGVGSTTGGTGSTADRVDWRNRVDWRLAIVTVIDSNQRASATLEIVKTTFGSEC